MGDRKRWALLVAAALVVGACSDSTPDPTLATGTTAPPTAPPTTTTSSTAPPTTEATTTQPPSTTESPDVRLAEIQQMVQAATIGRLVAIFEKDPEALLEWVGSQQVYDGSIQAMDRMVFLQRPSSDNYAASVEEVLLDRADCVVTRTAFVVDEGVIEGSTGGSTLISIWWPSPTGKLLDAAAWEVGTPQSQWLEECDIAVRGVTP